MPTIVLASLLFVLPQAAAVQDGRSLLQIRVSVAGSDGTVTPVPRHGLLVSDDPPTAPPRRIQTAPDGTASVRLRPGRYMVESDQPVRFDGRIYQWIQMVEVEPGRDSLLELTAGNAETGSAAPDTSSGAASLEADPSSVLLRWQDSVVAVWSPTARGTGFVADLRGLVVTTGGIAGSASSLEVELSPQIKLASRVLVADPVRDVAVLWIDPTVAPLKAVPMACTPAGRSPVKDGEAIVAIEAPFRRPRGTTSGTVGAIEGRVIVADLVVAPGGAGGPVFAADDRLVGMTSLDEEEYRLRRDSRVTRIEEVCAALSAAELKLKEAAPPGNTRLPMEPERPFPAGAMDRAAAGGVRRLEAYRMSSSAYDITFITPALMNSAQNQEPQPQSRDRGGNPPDPRTIDPLDDFSNWSEYVSDLPAVLLIRVTPKLVEGFWTKVARGAAQTQGVALPPIKRFKPGFAGLQVFCGDDEVAPIHPFKIQQRVSESDAIYEGLHIFDPGALGPSCGTVRLVLFSEKDPQEGDSRTVDARLLQQVWDDFAPYRALLPDRR